jgi:hypothetical protein
MIFHPARGTAFMGELKPNINIVNCGGSRPGLIRLPVWKEFFAISSLG